MSGAYPFTPKSSAKLRPGDFWAIPLQDGSFACGRVIELPPKGRPGAKVSFLGGLLGWHSANPPTAESIAASPTIEQGAMHVLSITSTGGQIIGHRSLESDGIEPFEMINGNVVQRGFEPLRPWKRSDNELLPTFSTWGYNVIWLRAHKHFLGYIPNDG
jgi:Immunity protein 26